MTYPEAQESLAESRTLLQGATHRIEVLQPAIEDAHTVVAGLVGEIPPVPLGGYVDEPKEEFVAAVLSIHDMATTLSARILPE